MFTLNVTNNYFQDVGGHFVPIPGGDGFQVFGVSSSFRQVAGERD
jgi:hypothetical protein